MAGWKTNLFFGRNFKMQKAWYILNYHDISWEHNYYLNSVGESFPPDIFEEHVKALKEEFELVSIQEGWKKLQTNSINAPLLSFWFDDGYVGVRHFAEPILSDYKITGGIAVNSDFLLRKNFFWRLKLSYLKNVDRLRSLYPILYKYGFKAGDNVRRFTLIHANEEIISAVNDIYERHTSLLQRQDAWRLFDTVEGIQHLREIGWDISNHTCGHLPLQNVSPFTIEHQFKRCDELLNEYLNLNTTFWVLPFGQPFYDVVEHQKLFESIAPKDKVMVYNNNTLNKHSGLHKRSLYRISPRLTCSKQLIKQLRQLRCFEGW